MTTIEKNAYKVKVKSISGDKIVVLSNGTRLPIELCQVAAGKDSWMRTIETKCRTCKCTFALKDSDSAYYCQECYDNDDLDA